MCSRRPTSTCHPNGELCNFEEFVHSSYFLITLQNKHPLLLEAFHSVICWSHRFISGGFVVDSLQLRAVSALQGHGDEQHLFRAKGPGRGCDDSTFTSFCQIPTATYAGVCLLVKLGAFVWSSISMFYLLSWEDDTQKHLIASWKEEEGLTSVWYSRFSALDFDAQNLESLNLLPSPMPILRTQCRYFPPGLDIPCRLKAFNSFSQSRWLACWP